MVSRAEVSTIIVSITMNNRIKRSRGRPRTFDRTRALEAALIIFWRQGYEASSITQLTKAMKITAPSLYAAFGSKEQLYRDVLDLYVSTHGDFVVRGLAAQGIARDVFVHLLNEAAIQFSRPGWPSGCLVANGALRCAQDNLAVREVTAMLRHAAQDAVRQRIDQAIIDHEVEPDIDSAGLAAFYASIVQGMSVQAVDGATREQLMKIGEFAMAAWPAKRS